MKPKLTVCIVTYNHERYIRECLQSVLAQDVEADLELLVGDDDSGDATASIVAELAAANPGRIRLIRNSPRLGGSMNYRNLMELARGDFIAHLDGDDYWLPGKLAEQLALLEKYPEAVAAYSNAVVCNDKGEVLGKFNNSLPELFDLAALLVRGNFLNQSSMLYRGAQRERLLEMAFPCLDYQFHLRLAQAGPVVYSNKALVVYRAGTAGSVLTQINESVRDRYWKAMMSVSDAGVADGIWDRMLADFMRRVVFRAVRTRSLGLVRRWWPLVGAQARSGRAWLLLLTGWCCLGEIRRQLTQTIFAKLSGTGQRVFYFR
jgi:glycosyltransferase involved in cell wall biosynthesis